MTLTIKIEVHRPGDRIRTYFYDVPEGGKPPAATPLTTLKLALRENGFTPQTGDTALVTWPFSGRFFNDFTYDALLKGGWRRLQ